MGTSLDMPGPFSAMQFSMPLELRHGGLCMCIWHVAHILQVHNPHTAYTAVMSARDGTLRPFVRVAMCPKDPASTFADARYLEVCQA